MTRRPAAPCARPACSIRLRTGLAALALGAALLPGCFLGRPYEDFRAYYNTFYNAEQAYEDGLEQITREDEPVDRNRYLTVFAVPDRGRGGSIQAFDDAVDKAAAVLRDRPETRFADDALLLIGKAYYYQENNVGAARKFNEAIEVALERGDEDRADEARFWLGRTLAASRRYDEAAAGLRLAVEREGVDRRWEAQMQLALGDLFVRAGRYEEAAEALEAGLDRVRKGDTAARAQFLLGQVYETLGRYDEAAASYAAVESYKPLYELGYAAKLSEALVLGLRADRADEGLARLRKMRRDDKNFENLAEVEVARARLLLASGRPAQARDLLQDQLYDRNRPAGGTARTEAYYRLGEVYRDGFRDYVRASTYLDTASTSFRPLPRDVTLTPDALRDVEEEAGSYAAFADVARRVAAYDSLLFLGSLDDEAYADAIERIRQDLVAERRREEQERRRLETQGGFARGGGVGGFDRGDRGGDEGAIGGGARTAGAAAAGGGAEDGFLGYRNPARVQQSLVAFRLVWGNRPLAPNWRRAAAVGALTDTGGPTTSDAFAQASTRDAYDVVVDDADVPRTEPARRALRAERAGARYELGNRLFLQLGRADSAATWFLTVLDEDAESPVALRARYALAEVRREQGRDDEAEALYRRLLQEADPASDLARQVRDRLGLPQETVSADSTSLAAAAYAEARRVWQDGRYTEALESLFDVEAAYPRTDAAPRALLAAGLAYTEWAQRDTLDAVGLFDPLPVRRRSVPDSVRFDLDALYDGLEADYRGTPYAERAEDLQAALDPFRPAPDTLAPDSTFAPDALAAGAGSVGVDSLAAASAGAGVSEGTESPLFGMSGFDPGQGGYAWVVTRPGPPAAEQASAFAERGYRVAVLTADRDGLPIERVVIGQFETEAEARAAETDLPAEAPDDRWVVALPEDPAAYVSGLGARLAEDEPVEDGDLSAFQEQVDQAVDAALNAMPSPEDGVLPGDRLLDEEPEVVADRFEQEDLFGEAPLDATLGGFSWQVAVSESRRAIDAIRQSYTTQGFRTALHPVNLEAGPGFGVLVGQFATAPEARAARSLLRRRGEGGLTLVAIGDLFLLEEGDGEDGED